VRFNSGGFQWGRDGSPPEGASTTPGSCPKGVGTRVRGTQTYKPGLKEENLRLRQDQYRRLEEILLEVDEEVITQEARDIARWTGSD
jgi:hypothetical protein